MPNGKFENLSMPSSKKPEEIGDKEPIIEEKKAESVEGMETPEKEESTETEDNLKLEQIKEELEKKEKIETIEKLPFSSKNKMELLSTFLGEKPAAFFDSKEWLPADLPPEQKKAVNEELLENTEKALKDLDLFYEIKKRKSGEFSYILASKTKEKLTELSKAFKKEDWGRVGLALGYPISAAEAHLKRLKEKGTEQPIRALGEIVEKSLSEEEKKRLIEEGSYKFLTFKPSLEGWREEIKLARKYQEIVKKESPIIYEEVMKRQYEYEF